jgi:hypothetical protein
MNQEQCLVFVGGVADESLVTSASASKLCYPIVLAISPSVFQKGSRLDRAIGI